MLKSEHCRTGVLKPWRFKANWSPQYTLIPILVKLGPLCHDRYHTIADPQRNHAECTRLAEGVSLCTTTAGCFDNHCFLSHCFAKRLKSSQREVPEYCVSQRTSSRLCLGWVLTHESRFNLATLRKVANIVLKEEYAETDSDIQISQSTLRESFSICRKPLTVSIATGWIIGAGRSLGITG